MAVQVPGVAEPERCCPQLSQEATGFRSPPCSFISDSRRFPVLGRALGQVCSRLGTPWRRGQRAESVQDLFKVADAGIRLGTRAPGSNSQFRSLYTTKGVSRGRMVFTLWRAPPSQGRAQQHALRSVRCGGSQGPTHCWY